MRSNILLKFRDCALELVARNADATKKAMAWAYGVGDSLVLTIPLVQSGFLQTVWHAQPNWHLLATAYGSDPLPLLVSTIYVAGAYAIGKGRFALGHAGYSVGASLLAINLHMHHEEWTALSVVPTIVGGAFGASYKFLEESFGHHENSFVRNTLGAPKRMAGLSFLFSSAPMVFTSAHDKIWSLFGTGLSCLAGNLTSMLLPPDDQSMGPLSADSPVHQSLVRHSPFRKIGRAMLARVGMSPEARHARVERELSQLREREIAYWKARRHGFHRSPTRRGGWEQISYAKAFKKEIPLRFDEARSRLNARLRVLPLAA